MYGSEPRNLTPSDVQRIVHETLRSQSSVGSYAPQSIPWEAVRQPNAGVNSGSGRTGDYGFTPLATAPTGALICDGAAVSRSVYSSLFAVLGTAYGVGDGSTTFNLPDWDGVFLAGATGGTYSPGDTGGADTVTLDATMIPAHTHTGPSHTHSTPAHTHPAVGGGVFVDNLGGGGANITSGGGGYTTSSTTGSGGSGTTGSGGTGNTGSTGGGGSHENRPPFLAVTVYIWT